MARDGAGSPSGLAIAADAQFPVDFFVLETQTSKWSGHAIAVEHWKGEHAEGPGRLVRYSTTPHIAEYQRVSPFLGARHATPQAWGGREITGRTRAHLKKTALPQLGVCSAAEAKLAKGGGGRGNGPARQTS